jgi:SAM-dependent methyltransferase
VSDGPSQAGEPHDLAHADFWRRYDEIEVRLTAWLSERMLDLAAPSRGDRVLDLAGGRGEPAVRALHRVGPDGSVLSVDPSPRLLAMARERAAAEGAGSLATLVAPAETAALPTDGFDLVTCRWGLMYMQDPLAALRNAAGACRCGAQLVAAVWCAPDATDYRTLPREALRGLVEFVDDVVGEPGPFRFADATQTVAELAGAGWRVVHQEEHRVEVFAADTVAEVVRWAEDLGIGRLLDGCDDRVKHAWRTRCGEAIARRGGPPFTLGGLTRLLLAARRDGMSR